MKKTKRFLNRHGRSMLTMFLSISIIGNAHSANKDWRFVENKGQLMDKKHHAQTDIKYYIHTGGLQVFCKPGKLSFVFISENKTSKISEASGMQDIQFNLQSDKMPEPQSLNTSRMDFVIKGANLSAQITASDQQAYYENYYTTGDANHGISNVHTYKKVVYKNIYPNIDMELTIGTGTGLEYSFLVHPGGNVNDIKMTWNGAKEKQMKDQLLPSGLQGAFQHCSALGTIEESTPKSFSEANEIQTDFVQAGAFRGFKVSSYDKSKDLLIDPTFWATYYGGGTGDGATGVCTDGTGNVFMTGSTSSTTDIATTGAYQSRLIGSVDEFVAEYSKNGDKLWSTYYGSGTDYAHGITIDGNNNLFVVGVTQSSGGLATSGAFKSAYSGKYNGTLAQFSPSGKLVWGTYIGASSSTNTTTAYAVCVDGSSNVYVTGRTDEVGIATSGTHQTSIAGNTDVYIAKFNNAGSSLIWATYYGGESAESGISLYLSGNNIYVSGNTQSTGGIATSGAYQTNNAGQYDLFLAQFNASTGALNSGTYYGGSGNDYGAYVTGDAAGNIYLGGNVASSGLGTSGTYQSALAGSTDAIIIKFNGTTGARDWATYFGQGNEGPGYIATDQYGHVLMTGYTGSSSGIATKGAFQTSYGGSTDAFLSQFNSNDGTLNWASYLGGTAQDMGAWIYADNLGNVLVAGSTQSSSGIATAGSLQPELVGSQDAFLVKFNIFGSKSEINQQDQDKTASISVYPNPASNLVNIDLNKATNEIATLKIVNTLGSIIYTEKVSGIGEIHKSFDLSNCPSGTYIVQIVSDNEMHSQVVIKH